MEQYARIQPLFGASADDVAEALKALLQRLGSPDLDGRMRVSVISAEKTDRWDLDLRGRKQTAVSDARRQQRAAERIDLEMIVSSATWSEIVSGRLAPLEAFGTGKLRFRGDASLANAIYERLKDDRGGLTTVCR